MFNAFLDTNVLWPSLQRDFLLSLAIEGVYRPLWSEAILDELEYHEALKLVERHGFDEADAARRAARLVGQMREHFSDAIVERWEALEGTYGLPDVDDEHVVAAAHIGGAGAIVTHNAKDFPAALLPASIAIIPPAEFAYQQVMLRPRAAFNAVKQLAARSGRFGPELTVAQVIDTLETRYEMTDAAAALRDLL